MNYKLGQNLIEWSFKIKQECLIVWSEVLDDPNPIHLNKNKASLNVNDLAHTSAEYSPKE